MQVQDDIGARRRVADRRRGQRDRRGRHRRRSARRYAPLRAPDDAQTLRRFAGRPARLACRAAAAIAACAARRGTGSISRARLRDGHAQRRRGDAACSGSGRATRPRPMLLLIDVSGSMKARTDAHLALAHALVHAAPRVEVFTFGTRLTRADPRAAAQEPRAGACPRSSLVADWDGGTRIGDALQAFLAVPRFAGYARGATRHRAVRRARARRPDHDDTRRAAPRGARLAASTGSRRSPSIPQYRPETEALRAIRPLLDLAGRRRAPRRASAARSLPSERRKQHDGTGRRTSSHLATGRSAVAAGTDAAAHLRTVRADPARLSDRGIPRRFAGPRASRSRLRAGELGTGTRAGRGAVRGRVRAPGQAGRIAIVAYADMLAEDIRPAARRV